MILADVFVPSIDTTYNFALDENALICDVVEELLEMIERKEHTAFDGERNRVELIDRESRRVLPKNHSLLACSIPTGSELILI